jgi:hypothetical protein
MAKYFILIVYLILCRQTSVSAQVLVGTDGLGRTIPQFEKVGGVQKHKQVAMFYFLWHEVAPALHWDLHEIVSKNPEVLEDFDHPKWGGDPKSGYGMYYWGQPLYGYYRADDYWVHLRSMQLLTDAGVDLLVIDATNRLTYPKQANVLMQAMDAVRAQGKNPPKIVFYTNTSSGETMQEAYNQFYKDTAPFRHPECWYYLDGKPLIIGHSIESKDRDFNSFFTFRESQWPNEDQKMNSWPWISFERPQKVFVNQKGENEIINVSVAQHPNPTAGMGGSAFYGNLDNWGRSYRNGKHGDSEKDIVFGYNFQEQWDHAIKQNTPFVYVTGWNEWIAGKFPSRDENPEHSWFCDQASPEYSRDIEPSLTSGLKDHYYMQLVANIRRYKGTEANPILSKMQTIQKMKDWEKALPVYEDYVGETNPRDHLGVQSNPVTQYSIRTGRNDFKNLKVARDNQYFYFYAQTVQNITKNQEDNWMNLYLDIDQNHKTGWNGYDYRVIRGMQLQTHQDGVWRDVQNIKYQVENNEIMFSIPKKYISGSATKQNFEFKWSDNMQDQNDPMDWYIHGDVAPGGRFNFVVSQ